MRYVSLFSGVEAASVAWEGLGWEPMAFSEIEPFPCEVLKEHYPEVPNLGDVTKIYWGDFIEANGMPDLIVGGSPCQSFSIAGNREGLKGESGLMFEYIRAVREVMPRYFVWENVPGALSCEKGAAFGQLLSEMDDLGYGLAWRVLDAQFFGVAQRRRRVFLVGCLGDAERAAEILFEPEGLRWDSPSSREKRKELAAGAERGAACAGFKQGNSATAVGNRHAVVCIADDAAHAAIDYDVSGTLKCGGSAPAVAFAANQRGELRLHGGDGEVVGAIPASTSGKQVNAVMQRSVVRRLTPRECERMQGLPDDWTKVPYRGKPADECPDTPRYKALGNSMAVPVMRWIGERIQQVEEQS